MRAVEVILFTENLWFAFVRAAGRISRVGSGRKIHSLEGRACEFKPGAGEKRVQPCGASVRDWKTAVGVVS